MILKRRISWLILVLSAALVLPRAAYAQPRDSGDDEEEEAKDGAGDIDTGRLFNCKKARGRFKVNLKPDIELKDLVTWAFSFTCRNFVFSSGIGGRSAKVTMMTPREMSAQQAWRVFLVALQSMGLTVVPKGNVLEIVEMAQAKQSPLPLYRKGRPSARDQMVRVVLRPEHVPAEDVAQVLSELKSKGGEVKAVPKAGVVMVTDLASNVQKMSSLMLTVDAPGRGGENLYLIRLRHASATDIAAKLEEIIGTKQEEEPAPAANNTRRARRRAAARRRARQKKNDDDDASTTLGDGAVASAVPSKIIPEERTNSLLVLATEPAYLRVRALVRRLDVALDVEGEGRIHVYFLENADAEELATTLTTVISGIEPAGEQQQGARGRRQQRRRAQPQAEAAGSAAFEGEVRVTHDKPTNSLVIVASVGDFLALREVVRKLDVPRPQVYIEATIVEVSVDNSLELGTSFHGGDEQDGSLLIGGVQHDELSSINLGTLISARGLIGGVLGPLLPNAEQLLGTSIPSYGVLFQALATDGSVNVLSSPHILTSDNQEAEISVGENIPFQSALTNLPIGGGQQGGAGSFFPTQSIQRQDVALTLKITPQINASEMVRLEIDLEISDIASRDFQGLGPSWAKRTIKDTVIVRDQQAVVLGGLMRERETANESKVPLLGDIPILGYLFKFKTKSKEKTNLLVLLTPYIVKSQIDIEKIVGRRVREQREFVRTFSTFDTLGRYRPEIDYRRKRGLVEEINRRIAEIEEEAEVLRSLDERLEQVEEGRIDYVPEEEEEGAEGAEEGEGEGEGEAEAEAETGEESD